VALRREMYRNGSLASDQLLLPVIVVGNINVGGTGKTPLTLALAQQLIEHGWHPIIVSRGFGGTAQQPQYVGATSDALQVGDEPLLMARRIHLSGVDRQEPRRHRARGIAGTSAM